MFQDTALPAFYLEALGSRSRTISYPSLVSAKQLYTSLPLPSDSHYIRVLDLDASDITCQTESNAYLLKGHLRVERLTESSSFTALSYVWGKDDAITHTVFCQPQGCNIPITANCHAALCQIRKQYGGVTIWVDSICINQADTVERSNQIPLMQEIYSWAESVYIWLGEGNGQSDMAMQYLENRARYRARLPFTWLAILSTRPRKKEKEMADFRRRTWNDPFGRLKGAASFSKPKVYLNEVLDREWVRRAWTLQEAALAPNPVILCGDQILRWEDLILAIYDPDDDFLHDCTRDPLEKARLQKSIARWRSVFDLWLNLPRPCTGLPIEITRGPNTFSLARLLQSLSQVKKLPQGPYALNITRAVWCSLLGMVCLTLWAYCTYAVVVNFNLRTSSLSVMKKFAAWYFLAWTWFFLGWKYLSLVRQCLRLSSFVLCGHCSDWFLKRATPSETQVLSAIHIALRERACTDPRDRSFALFGILQSLGVATPQPDVQGTVGETYRLFLQTLLAWQPSSLAMVIDAGCPTKDGPSWVPNFMFPSPSIWLTARYTIGSRTSATWRYVRPSSAVHDNELRLPGDFKGAVTNITRLTPFTQRDGEERLKSSLSRILCLFLNIQKKVSREIPNDVLVSSIFAVLRGLTPQRGPTHTEVSYDASEYGSSRTKSEPLPRWKGPYDFAQQKEDFKTFCHLYDLLLSFLKPTVCEDSGRVIPPESDIETAFNTLKSNAACYKCFVKTVNILVAEKRCVFVLDSGFIGSGPRDMKIGDDVFLLAGVPVPMVLRKDKGKKSFTVRGAALVHGFMHGERFNSKKLEQITLV